MGNSSSNNGSQIFSEDTWNLSQLSDLKEGLGSRTSHLYSSYPKSIPEEKVVSNIDLRHFSCSDGNKLNEFLEQVLQNIQGEFLKENWTQDAFPSKMENLKLLDNELNAVTLTEEELQTIREQFSLPEKVMETQIKTQKAEGAEEGETKDTEDEVTEDGAEEEEKVEVERDIEQVYQGYSVYQFPEDGLGMPLDMKTVGIESCFVGCQDERLVVMAPSEEPLLTRCIRFDWQVVQVGQDSIRLILQDARGVVFENGKSLDEVSENYFENLDKAYQSYQNSNTREMSLFGNKYLTWVKQIRDAGELQALAGGEIDGEMVSLGDFLDKMQI
tara:strand:- start:30 stop:1016 length:987 start_codon:yes stop_codon:yes gene_type:complete